jgi:tetratricopeptide (TPR) repeat protein
VSGLVSRARDRWPLVSSTLLGALLALAGALGTGRAPSMHATAAEGQTATFVGRPACASCHPEQDRRWRGSDHDLAMQVADRRSVLGDFGGATLTRDGVASRFFRRDGKFFVRTEGPDGRVQDFPVAYTFGVRPLQQYLVALPGGRFQALGIAWDTRPHGSGGQRWFRLDAGERIDPGDPRHWTGRDQTWNRMCADCHSTGLRKNYRPDLDRYETTWAELNVACEACHGPGSRHVAWAKTTPASERPVDGTMGLVVRLRDRRDVAWPLDAATGIARRAGPPPSRVEVEVCAGCHARRSVLEDRGVQGRPFLDTHRPALLVPDLYHPDGQILGEVYEYGSFLQSRMYRAGVTCSDCHDPHGLRVARPATAACARCHARARFDTTAHHHHRPGTAGASCLGCHMPARTYMTIDARRDHSLRVPRPDLSVKLGTPDACTACHRDRTPQWAAAAVVRWYGHRRRPVHYGEALHAARRGLPGAEAELRRLVADREMPGIVRATAVSLLRPDASPASIQAVERALTDDDPLVRLAAVEAAATLALDTRLRMLAPALDASPLAVRMEAARVLADAPIERLTAEQRGALERGLAEYRRALELNADRPEAQVSLGDLADRRGERQAAEQAYQRAITLDPTFVPAYVNLADHHGAHGQDGRGEDVLRRGLARNPDAPALHHSLGLLLVRERRYSEAVGALARAAQLAPDVARFGYVYAIALRSTGQPDRALEVLARAHDRHPGDAEILRALANLHRERGARDAALTYAKKLLEVAPDDPRARQIIEELGRGR